MNQTVYIVAAYILGGFTRGHDTQLKESTRTDCHIGECMSVVNLEIRLSLLPEKPCEAPIGLHYEPPGT